MNPQFGPGALAGFHFGVAAPGINQVFRSDMTYLDDPAEEEEEESWSQTTWETWKSKHVWLIDEFRNLMTRSDEKTSLKSAVFTLRRGKDKFAFQLKILPKGDPYGEYVAIHFISLNNFNFQDRGMEVMVSFVVKSKDDKAELFKTRKTGAAEAGTASVAANIFVRPDSRQTPWEKFSPTFYGETKQFANPFKRSELEQKADTFLPQGQLTLVCNMKILIPTTNVMKNPTLPDDREYHPEIPGLATDIADFSKHHLFKDFVLVCGERRFDCHKAILAARSDVFHANFAHQETKEVCESESKVTDVSADTMEKMLEFIYTDRVTNLPPHAAELFVAADKYNLKQLKAMCITALLEGITVENAAEIMVLGYLHEAKELKERAMDFVTDNMTRVAESEGWKALVEIHPKILQEILLKEFSKPCSAPGIFKGKQK